ncbi:MAG: hypothetical protein AAY43_00585 [Methanosarcina sp. 795]|nr:MAG: hypothetical protein AAY43_00585 [Methanosarcina sp. 795]
MYIKLLIILFILNLPLFALQLFDCENFSFWNPFYFISQNKYINLDLLLFNNGRIVFKITPLPLKFIVKNQNFFANLRWKVITESCENKAFLVLSLEKPDFKRFFSRITKSCFKCKMEK